MNKKVALAAFLFTLSFRLVSIAGREAPRPAADIGEVVKQLASQFIAGESTLVDGPPCLLDIQKDLPKGDTPQPLYLIPNTQQFWLPNARGFIQVPRGKQIELHCSKSFANFTQEGTTQKIPKHTRTLRPSCLHDRTFTWHGEKFEFNQFICAQPPRYLVERTGDTCAGHSTASFYRVGFNVTQARFVQTMLICHDDVILRTHYTQHRLLPANLHFQRHVKRLNFSKAGYFKQHNMNFLYAQQNQKAQIAKLLCGQNHTVVPFFDNATLFLARGHLAAKSDQIYANQQRTTFTFFNVAPQWQSFNGGQWAQLEDEVRKFVARHALDIDCYTGTWGTQQLKSNTTQADFFLSNDVNNNGLLPVPMLYYRVLVERTKPWRGIVLVGVNNPHVTLPEIYASYVICEDIREEVVWLKWIRNGNLKKGYLYACAVPEFLKVVKHLPRKLESVKQILQGT